MPLDIEHHPQHQNRAWALVWTRKKNGSRVATHYETEAEAKAMIPEMARRVSEAEANGWDHA